MSYIQIAFLQNIWYDLSGKKKERREHYGKKDKGNFPNADVCIKKACTFDTTFCDDCYKYFYDTALFYETWNVFR